MSLSRAHVLQCDPAERERVLVRVHAHAGTHADLAGQEAVDLPYLTVTWRSRRRTCRGAKAMRRQEPSEPPCRLASEG